MYKLLLVFIFTLSVSAFAQNTGNESYNNAYRYYSVGDYTKAIKYYNDYLSSHTSDAKAFNERGRCYESLKQYDNALSDYSAAVNLRPNNENYLRDRGYVHLKMGNPNLALSDFNTCVILNSGNAYAYSARTLAYIALGNYEFSLMDINKAMQFDPSNANYLITSATVYSIIDDTLNLYKDIDTILKINPVRFFSSFKSQDVIISYININSEIVNLTNILINNPADDFAYFERGFHYYITGKYQAALSDFESCKQYAAGKKEMSALSDRFIANIKLYGNL